MSEPFCECEYAGCTQHIGSDVLLPADLKPISTIYGTFKICIACREAHPIPSDMRKEVSDNIEDFMWRNDQ